MTVIIYGQKRRYYSRLTAGQGDVVMVSDVVSIGQAAQIIGVAVSTLRRWEAQGKFLPFSRTLGGHRRYSIRQISEVCFPEPAILSQKKTIAYARVSSHAQRADLATQAAVLVAYCQAQGVAYEVISDLGSGLNCEKRGLKKLLKLSCRQEISKLVLTHRDRLLRCGSKLILQLCENFGIEVVILHKAIHKSFEEELAADLVEIITVFSSKRYGKRSHANRQKLGQAA